MSLPSLHRALYAFLSGHSPLTALVGQRVYPGIAPQDTPFPYCTVHELAVASHYYLGGASGTHDTLVQIDCWALSAQQAKQLGALVRHAVDGLPAVWDGLEIDGVFVEAELDDFDAVANAVATNTDASERVLYRRMLTLNIWHEREVPA